MKGTKQVAIRMENADADFVEMLMNMHGITKDQAQKVLSVFYKFKVVKRDAVIGRVAVVHGVYLDRIAINNALAM